MKKLIGIILIVLLALSSIASYGESTDLVPFEPTVTKTLDYTADDIMSSGFLRASVTVFLTLDLIAAVNDEDIIPDLGKSTFIGKGDNLIYMYAHTLDDTSICIGYLPSEEYAVYTIIGASLPDSFVKITMSQQCTDGYYENDSEEIAAVIDEVNRIMDS